MIWIQVRDLRAEYARLAGWGSGYPGTGDRALGLTEMWIRDPDGVRIVVVEVPGGHPLRRDPRPGPPPR